MNWDLRADELEALGGEAPVVVEIGTGMKFAISRIVLNPGREQMTMWDPSAVSIIGPRANAPAQKSKSGEAGPDLRPNELP
jgi:hypothetical protein